MFVTLRDAGADITRLSKTQYDRPRQRNFPSRIRFNLNGLDYCSCYVLMAGIERQTRQLAHANAETDGKAGRAARAAGACEPDARSDGRLA